VSAEPCKCCGRVECAEESDLHLELLEMEGAEPAPSEPGQPVDTDATRTRLVVGSDRGDSPGFCLRAGQIVTAAEYDHGQKLLRVYVEDSAPLRDLLSAAKQWRSTVEDTEERERLSSPDGIANRTTTDQALFEAIDKAEGKT